MPNIDHSNKTSIKEETSVCLKSRLNSEIFGDTLNKRDYEKKKSTFSNNFKQNLRDELNIDSKKIEPLVSPFDFSAPKLKNQSVKIETPERSSCLKNGIKLRRSKSSFTKGSEMSQRRQQFSEAIKHIKFPLNPLHHKHIILDLFHTLETTLLIHVKRNNDRFTFISLYEDNDLTLFLLHSTDPKASKIIKKDSLKQFYKVKGEDFVFCPTIVTAILFEN